MIGWLKRGPLRVSLSESVVPEPVAAAAKDADAASDATRALLRELLHLLLPVLNVAVLRPALSTPKVPPSLFPSRTPERLKGDVGMGRSVRC